jgi:hypothetical protein
MIAFERLLPYAFCSHVGSVAALIEKRCRADDPVASGTRSR